MAGLRWVVRQSLHMVETSPPVDQVRDVPLGYLPGSAVLPLVPKRMEVS